MKMLLPNSLVPPSPLDLRIAFISTYPPRRCGIGTYTKDLATSFNNLNPERLVEIIALDDPLSESLDYPWEVSHRIRQNEWDDYEKVLDYLNKSIIDVVCVQHEYGIYGGWDGDYILKFVRRLKKPFLVTLHTILENPSDSQKKIIQELAELSRGIVVMLETASDILREVYRVPLEKIIPIHHGTPDFPFSDDGAKRELNLEGRIVMSSVNLVSEGKGIEYAIQALPEIVKTYPDFLYLVVGQTHPVILEREGEVYRNKLESLVSELGLERNVVFVNKYVTLDELIAYVRASDFYITPYENMEQISSGSLAYAIAAGKLCISTPYLYAKEMLAGKAGYLVEPRNPDAIKNALIHGLNHPKEVAHMRRKCYSQGRRMIWARVGYCYLRVIEHLLQTGVKPVVFLPPSLQHLEAITDERGVLEHTRFSKPKLWAGYSVDDNARALIAAIQYDNRDLAEVYLDFLLSAEHKGKMYCDMDSKGRFVGKPSVGDWFGRAFWAACYTVQEGQTQALRKKALDLVRRLLPNAVQARFIRTNAYLLLGLVCLEELEWDEFIDERKKVFDHAFNFICSEYELHSDSEWHWPEPHLTYDNPRIAQALLECGRVFDNPSARRIGLELLDFVLDQTFDILQNHFRFIGNQGWLKKGETKAYFDEQPIDAGATVQACYAAYRLTGISYYRDMAKKALAWYHGDNILRRPVYNHKRGSVHDGISFEGVSANQGAESMLEYLLAYSCYAKLVEEGIASRDLTYPAPSNRTITQTAQS